MGANAGVSCDRSSNLKAYQRNVNFVLFVDAFFS